MWTKTAIVLMALVAIVHADIYMHAPRGSNNRLDETNRNRNDANRLFDSQNNNKGGYNVNVMEYYGGSQLRVEWTNQHSCGDGHAECQLIFQYMCEDPTGEGLRNGQEQTRIPEGMDKAHQYGRHESADYWNDCMVRQRNTGLFIADRNIADDESAMNTRQNDDENNNNKRRGYECPEERDYYPYWHPTPWKDIVVFTDRSAELCPLYTSQSENVQGKGFCDGLREATPGNDITSGSEVNNMAECNDIEEFTWLETDGHGLPAPQCIDAAEVWSRPNHLGNGIDGYQNHYEWTLPVFETTQVCVLRLRYNISTTDYDGWNTFSEMNGNTDNPVFTGDPNVDVGDGTTPIDLKLRVSTDQMGRTFQDRSSTFLVKVAPVAGQIINLNVMGQRGNIVENYPSVEYDFVPTVLSAGTGVLIHRQVTGSNTTPNGAGSGQDETDRTNFVELLAGDYYGDSRRNYIAHGTNITQLGYPASTEADFDVLAHWATYNQNDDQTDDAAPHQDLGLLRYDAAGVYVFIGTRNNDFSNRSQKGRICIAQTFAACGGGGTEHAEDEAAAAEAAANAANKDKSKTDVATIGIIAGSSVAGLVVVGGGGAYVATHKDQLFGGFGGGAKAPAGYA